MYVVKLRIENVESVGDYTGDSKHRQQQGYRNRTDNSAENGYHKRLYKSHNALDRGFELFFIKIRYFTTDLTELSALFACAKHLYNAGINLLALNTPILLGELGAFAALVNQNRL